MIGCNMRNSGFVTGERTSAKMLAEGNGRFGDAAVLERFTELTDSSPSCAGVYSDEPGSFALKFGLSSVSLDDTASAAPIDVPAETLSISILCTLRVYDTDSQALHASENAKRVYPRQFAAGEIETFSLWVTET